MPCVHDHQRQAALLNHRHRLSAFDPSLSPEVEADGCNDSSGAWQLGWQVARRLNAPELYLAMTCGWDALILPLVFATSHSPLTSTRRLLGSDQGTEDYRGARQCG